MKSSWTEQVWAEALPVYNEIIDHPFIKELADESQLEGTENRIATVREDFNKVAKEYNTKIKQFPKNIFAGIFGFKEKPYFAAQAGAENAPKVSFD